MTPGADAPLAGLRVLDLAGASGAFAGRLLAALGADVALVEPPTGHAMRSLPPFATGRPAPDGSLFFHWYAAGKRSVVADRASPAGRALVERLARATHVVIVTDAPADTVALARRHPRAIVASITPFGHAGPRATWQATDLVAQAMGGLVWVNGHRGAAPLQALGLQAYHQASVLAAVGVLAELLGGPRDAGSRIVDVSLQAAVAAALEHVPGLFLGEGTIPQRQGSLHWTRAFRVGPCRDGSVLHSTMGDWTSLSAWVEADLGTAGTSLGRARWADVETRRVEAPAVFDVLDRWSAAREAGPLAAAAQLRRLPYAALAPPAALARHPQLRARDFFDARGAPPRTTAPFLLDGLRLSAGGAPALGEHHDAVVREWATAAPSEASRRRRPQPLAGIDVLDFTWVVAGPVATRTLADLGARVVRIEHPETPVVPDRRGGIAGTLMRGKRSAVLDLRDPTGRRLARELARRADVVADNFSARVMPQLGLDAATLRAERPDLVCLAMSGYGATGPWADRVSYGPTLQAETGFTLAMSEPGAPPAGLGYSYSDLASGHLAALAVLAALWRREARSTGATIDFSQLEALAGLVGPAALGAPDGVARSSAIGNASQEGPMAPHGVYPATGNDRWVAVAVRSDAEWRRLATLIGCPELGGAARFATTAARVAATAEVDALVAAWTRERPACEAARILQHAGIPAGPVADARDLLEDDPQLAARGHVVEVPTPEGRRIRLDASPILLSGASTAPSSAGAELGEHTRAVLAERLALGAHDLDQLEAAGTIVQWRASLG